MAARTLPPEILSQIVGHLTSYRRDGGVSGRDRNNDNLALGLAPYAPVSRAWRDVIEARTFKDLVLTSARCSTASRVLDERRLRLVRVLRLRVLLPELSPGALLCGLDADVSAQEAAFAGAVRSLSALLGRFAASGSASASASSEPVIELRFILEAPPKVPRQAWMAPVAAPHETSPDRYLYHLHLSAAALDALPELPMVSAFDVRLGPSSGHAEFQFSPAAVSLLASKMPRLAKIRWRLSDREPRSSPRARLRDGFAKSLDKLPLSMTHFDLRYHREQSKRHESLSPRSRKADPLTVALQKLSLWPNLVQLNIDASVEDSILWPFPVTDRRQGRSRSDKADDDAVTGLLFWPKLESLELCPLVTTPSGQRLTLAKSPSTLGIQRRPVDPDYINAMLLKAAHAAMRMPALICMLISVETFTFSYMAKEGQLRIRSEPLFSLDGDVMEAWAADAKRRLGENHRLRIELHDAAEEEVSQHLTIG